MRVFRSYRKVFSMSYIRDVSEKRTCFQERADYDPSYAPKSDLALVYGLDESLPERLNRYAQAGYVCQVMFGISWGDYRDYLDGGFDGKSHWDEGQRDRNGKELIHNPGVPYLVPTASFCDYLTERLKRAVDAGAEGAVIEEPELTAAAGYSAAFARAYEEKYGEPFSPQHESAAATARAASLKAELYAEAIERVSRGVRTYAASLGKRFSVTVATHSAINYSQWQIVSPVGQVGLMPGVDALIGQVWTGTSRTAQVYEGRVRERIFETALMEYASLVAAAGSKPVFLLTDPIEDSPAHSWEMYKKSYIDTLVACLLQPGVKYFEVCPWPRRVFLGRYPRVQPNIAQKDETSCDAETAKPIPADYASLLCGAFELLGSLPDEAGTYEGANVPLTVFLSESCLYERSTPDDIPCDRAFEGKGFKLLTALRAEKEGSAEACSRLLAEELEGKSEDKLNAFKESTLSPDFYGLTMPLVKHGLPLRFAFTSHIAAEGAVPKDIKAAILSYDFMKPRSPAVNQIIAAWVRGGGRLIFIGAGSPFADNPEAWWQKEGFASPEEHLFRLLGLESNLPEGSYPVGRGALRRVCLSPARICLKAERAEYWRGVVAETMRDAGTPAAWSNRFVLRRGPCVICAVMDESVNEEPFKLSGLYADMLSPTFEVKRDVTVRPGERAVLYDLAIANADFEIVGTQARVLSVKNADGSVRMELCAPKGIKAHIRLRLPQKPERCLLRGRDKAVRELPCEWDEDSHTALLSYDSDGQPATLELS